MIEPNCPQPPIRHPTLTATPNRRLQALTAFTGRIAWELAVVFAGVLGALWVDHYRDQRQRQEHLLRIADAVTAEVTHLVAWYRPWRDSIRVDFADWQSRVSHGQQPPPYFFRMPGAENPPTIAWDAAAGAGILDVLDPRLVFAIGNAYHEFSRTGDRVARYHALTEAVIFPAIGTMLTDSVSATYRTDSNRRWRDFLALQRFPQGYGPDGRLLPAFAGHAALTREVLAELDDKFAWMDSVRVQLEAAVSGLRTRM